MRILVTFAIPVAALALLAGGARADGPWSLGGYAGLSSGTFTSPTLGGWAVAHHWVSPWLGLGAEGGWHRWQHTSSPPIVIPLSGADGPLAYPSLARGGQSLWNASFAARLRGTRGDSRPHLDASFGMYALSPRGGVDDASARKVSPGLGLGVGFAGVRGLTPAMAFHFDWVDARPTAGWYFTAALGLQLAQRARAPI